MPRAFLFSSNRYLSGRKYGKTPVKLKSDSVTLPCSEPLDLSCTKSQTDLSIQFRCRKDSFRAPVIHSSAGSAETTCDAANLSILCQVTLCPSNELLPHSDASTSAVIEPSDRKQAEDKKAKNGRPKRKTASRLKITDDFDEDGVDQTTEPLDTELARKSPDYENKDDYERFMCQDCGKRYTTASNLTRHRQTHRSISDKTARKCPYCDRIYVSSPAYNMHIQTHVQGCECPHCQKRFSRQWLLQGHLRTHTGEKPFQCNKCEKRFADKSNLRAHIQTHSDEKPFLCSHCGKSFALRSYLTKHEEASCGKAVQEP